MAYYQSYMDATTLCGPQTLTGFTNSNSGRNKYQNAGGTTKGVHTVSGGKVTLGVNGWYMVCASARCKQYPSVCDFTINRETAAGVVKVIGAFGSRAQSTNSIEWTSHSHCVLNFAGAGVKFYVSTNT